MLISGCSFISTFSQVRSGKDICLFLCPFELQGLYLNGFAYAIVCFPLKSTILAGLYQHLKATNLSPFPKLFYHFSQRPREHLPFCFTALLFPANFPERASYTCILQFLPSDAMLGFYSAGSSISTCLKILFKGHQLLP